MKTLLIIICFISLNMCKSNSANSTLASKKDELINTQIASNNTPEAIDSKNSQIFRIKDYSLQQTGVVESKNFKIENDFYRLEYRYPYLDNESYLQFNRYIKNTYLNVEKVVNQILDDKEILCNEKGFGCDKDIKYLDYKIYSLDDELLSVLMFEENYYAGVAQSSYKFDCLNFNFNNGSFVSFNDFFVPNSEEFIFLEINKNITKALNSGELYNECWELTNEDFKVYKDNFVINDDHIRFYFDDCVICPSFTGTYYVDLPVDEIISRINVFKKNTLKNVNL